MLARRVLPLLIVALIVGLAVQAPAKPDTPTANVGLSCPPGLVNAAGPLPSPTATVTCLGWQRPDFDNGTAPASVLVRDRDARLGEPCWDMHYYRVTVLRVAGEVRGTFAIFGGASHGSMTVPDDQVAKLRLMDAYVSDMQIGSYEHGKGPLRCDIVPTYRFYCPATMRMDQICYTWLRRWQ